MRNDKDNFAKHLPASILIRFFFLLSLEKAAGQNQAEKSCPSHPRRAQQARAHSTTIFITAGAPRIATDPVIFRPIMSTTVSGLGGGALRLQRTPFQKQVSSHDDETVSISTP